MQAGRDCCRHEIESDGFREEGGGGKEGAARCGEREVKRSGETSEASYRGNGSYLWRSIDRDGIIKWWSPCSGVLSATHTP